MNKENISAVIRHILTFGGGIFIALGYLTQEQVNELSSVVSIIIGSIGSLLGLVTSLIDKAKTKKEVESLKYAISSLRASSENK